MLQVYVTDVSSVLDIRCIQVFHVTHISYCLESQGTRGVIVARHGRWGVGRGKARVDGRNARRAGSRRSGRDGARCACGAGLTARRTGWVKSRQADCACEASRLDARAQQPRWGELADGAGYAGIQTHASV